MRKPLSRQLVRPPAAALVPHLSPEILQEVIRRAGLERAADLVQAATPEQLGAVLDLDLWGASPAGEDEFDADRFGEWVETLVEHDVGTAARVVSRLDPLLVVTGLSRYVRVLDPGVLEPTEPSDDEPRGSGLFETDGLTAEVGGYIVQARRADAWDAIVRLLVELSAGQAECFHAVVRGCRRSSDAGGERDGLDDLLEPKKQLLHDLSLARDDRRAARGFTAAADARAFLAMARQGRPPGRRGSPPSAATLRRADVATGEAAAPRIAALDERARVLAADGLLPDRPRALLAGQRAGRREPGVLRPLLEHLRENDPDLCLDRERELAFLANSLVAGCSLQSRPFTRREASDAVVATCSLGLLRQPAPPSDDFLVGHDLIAVFEDGWGALHREVSLFAAERLEAMLRGVRPGRSDTLDGLRSLRQSLETHLEAGTPWLAREALDVLATLDTPAWYGLLGLLGECPVIPAVVPAIVERRTGRIDPQSFAFVATAADLDTVRAFVVRLPELLSGRRSGGTDCGLV